MHSRVNVHSRCFRMVITIFLRGTNNWCCVGIQSVMFLSHVFAKLFFCPFHYCLVCFVIMDFFQTARGTDDNELNVGV